MTYDDIIHELEANADPAAVEGMARFGITPEHAYGVSIPLLRGMARRIKTNHALALRLWDNDAHETRMLASMIDDPEAVTEQQLESWAAAFTDWAICDQVCMNLFRYTRFAWDKCYEWSARPEEFIKRAGFALMAQLAVSDKKAADEKFEAFFPIMKRESGDGRNGVKKAVNWALRQIGKRNAQLNRKAIAAGEEIAAMDSKSARWIAADALRELRSEAVQSRLATKGLPHG